MTVLIFYYVLCVLVWYVGMRNWENSDQLVIPNAAFSQ